MSNIEITGKIEALKDLESLIEEAKAIKEFGEKQNTPQLVENVFNAPNLANILA